MNQNEQAKIEERIFSANFYRHNFSDTKVAAGFLGITTNELDSLFEELEEPLHSFLYTMRVEDVKNHLQRAPHELLGTLTALYCFRSQLHLLWHFYKREKCTPHAWVVRNGLVSTR